MGWYVIVATIPIAVIGLALHDHIENGARNLYLIGSMLILLGLVLLGAELVGRRVRRIEDVGRADAIWIGLAQACALVPGVSRSGSTITAGLFLGLEREAAARFSFLLSIPAVVLSGLYGLTELATGDDDTSFGALLVATIFAFILGYLSIAFLLRYLANHSTGIFVVYRVVLGAVVIALASGDVIS
jgi:undecaprenyl-diphosphatase